MRIRRVMPNVVSDDLDASREFYRDFVGLEVKMDQPGFLMLSSPDNPTAQLTVVSPEPLEWDPHTCESTFAVEVEDVDAHYAEARRRGLQIVYPITDEAWGVRRFFVQAPDGSVLNINGHIEVEPH